MRTWSRLDEILLSVRDQRQTAVKSANGIGKTTMAACLVIWYLETHYDEDVVVLTTGSNWNTLANVLWPRILDLSRRKNIFPTAKPLKNGIWLSNTRYAISRSTNKPEGLQGVHSPNLLQIVEESSGMDAEIAAAISGNATGENDRRVYLGNPLVPHGVFYDWCHNPEVNTISISALEHPNVVSGFNLMKGAVTRAALEEKCGTEWGTECGPETVGAIYLPWCNRYFSLNHYGVPRVLGMFPDASEFSMIPRSLLDTAAQRKERPVTGRITLGIDPAASEFGDETAFSVACDSGIMYIEAHRGINQMEIAGIAQQLRDRFKVNTIGVDIGGGFGGGVYARLRELEVPVIAVDFSTASSTPQRWANLKAEIYYIFSQRVIHQENYYVPNDPLFLRQAAEVRIKPTSRGQDAIESKEEYKSRTGESPDRFEASVIANYLQRMAGAASNVDLYIPGEEEEEIPRNEPMWHR